MHDLICLPLAATMLLGGSPEARIGIAEASAPLAPIAPRHALSALMEAPELQLGERVSVLVQFEGEVEDWNPFLTRFVPDDYRCLRFWGDEQWLWIEEEYESPLAEVFVRKDTIPSALLAPARPHDRFELDLIVKEFHAGRPWIEIVEVHRTPEQTPEGTVLHAIRAIDLVEREAWTLAVNELDRALAPDLPGHVRRELEEIRKRCDAMR